MAHDSFDQAARVDIVGSKLPLDLWTACMERGQYGIDWTIGHLSGGWAFYFDDHKFATYVKLKWGGK